MRTTQLFLSQWKFEKSQMTCLLVSWSVDVWIIPWLNENTGRTARYHRPYEQMRTQHVQVVKSQPAYIPDFQRRPERTRLYSLLMAYPDRRWLVRSPALFKTHAVACISIHISCGVQYYRTFSSSQPATAPSRWWRRTTHWVTQLRSDRWSFSEVPLVPTLGYKMKDNIGSEKESGIFTLSKISLVLQWKRAQCSDIARWNRKHYAGMVQRFSTGDLKTLLSVPYL